MIQFQHYKIKKHNFKNNKNNKIVQNPVKKILHHY